MALNNNNNDISCKCTTPEYEIILNEQGPQGRQGEKGDAGFTPIISVKDNTPSNYTLNILTQDGQITTPNLKANLPAGGATGQVLTKNSGEQDDCSWQNLPASTIETEGIARLATEADFETTEDTEVSDNTIVTPALFNSEFEKQSANFVTTNTDQDIMGFKTFERQTSFHGDVVVRREDRNSTRVELHADDQPEIRLYNSNNWYSRIGLYNDTIMYIQAPFESDRIVINNYDLEDAPTGNAKDVVIYGNLINKNNNIASRVLNQDNVTAGNNITIDKTSTGITISSTGGTGGTSDYTQLTNKPQINGIELTGNKNGNDLGLANESEIEELGNELNQLANDVTNLDTNKQDKLVAGTNITIEGNVISATGGGEIPTNVVTTDTAQTITGQKVFLNSFVSSDATATTGNRVTITNNKITLSPNAGNNAVLDSDKLELRGGIDNSGLTILSSSGSSIIGQQNNPMYIYASQLERYSSSRDSGAIILDAKNYKNYANLSVNTLLKVDVTGLSTAITTGTTQNLLDLISLTGSATNIVTTANINTSNYNLTGGILKLPYIPTVNNKYTNAYCDYNIDVRITGTIDGSVNTAREFNIELQRASDNSIVETHNVTKTNTNDLTGKGVVFSTYTNTSSDPFIANGLKLVLNNTSGQTVTITGVTLLVKGRTY